MIESCKRASAERITAVMPYYGYARQDRKDEGRVPITAKLVANLITRAGADRVLTMDLHAAQIQGFFDVPVDHLYAAPVLNDHFLKMDIDRSRHRRRQSRRGKHQAGIGPRETAGGRLAIVDKRRSSAEKTRQENIIGGPVAGKVCLMFDDMISTAGCICGAAKSCTMPAPRQSSSRPLTACCAAALSSDCRPLLFEGLVITDTIPLAPEKALPKITVLSVAPSWARPSSASTATSRSAGCLCRIHAVRLAMCRAARNRVAGLHSGRFPAE